MQIFKKIMPLCLLLASGCGGEGIDFDALSGTPVQNPDGHETQLRRSFRVMVRLFDGQSAVRFLCRPNHQFTLELLRIRLLRRCCIMADFEV